MGVFGTMSTSANLNEATNISELTKEQRRAIIEEAEAEQRNNATLTITAALRARRFRKLLRNNALTGNDPSLIHLRMCVVRRIAAIGHLNMEDNVAKVCDWYRKVFHNEEGPAIAKRTREARGLHNREW